MRNYKKYLVIIPIILLIIVLSIVNFNLYDNNVLYITTDSDYIEPGYSASTIFGKDITNKVTIEGKVNTSIPGSYKLLYKLKYLWIKKTLERVVVVEKNTIENMDIILNGNNKIYQLLGNNYDDPLAYVINKKTNNRINIKLEIESNIDINNVGEYEEKYILNYENERKEITRKVIVYQVNTVLNNKFNNGNRSVNIEIIGINDYSYVILPNGNIEKENKFTYEVENKKYVFEIHTKNNEIIEYELNMDNNTFNYICSGVIDRNGTTLEVNSTNLNDIKKYEWIVNNTILEGENTYNYPNSLKNGKVKLSLNDGKSIEINCDIKDNLVYHFKYDENHTKPKMSCNTYTLQDKIILDEKLKKAVLSAGYGTRAGVVEAARFLVGELDYTIPYVGADRYNKEGLNIGQSNAWGCGSSGLDCFYFVYWALSQNGLPLGALYGGTKYKTREVLDRLRVGDYIYTPCESNCKNKYNINHIGLIIGIDDRNIYVAEETTGGINSLIVSKWDKYNMPETGKFSVVRLVDYPQEGNVTNMWVE